MLEKWSMLDKLFLYLEISCFYGNANHTKIDSYARTSGSG